jgi:hypothetical protein
VKYLVNDEQQENVPLDSAHGLVASLGAVRTLVPLAFTISENFRPIDFHGLGVSWSNEAIQAFRKIREGVDGKGPSAQWHLPYASLRGLMEVTLRDVTRITGGLGLDDFAVLSRRKIIKPFLYIDGSSAQEVRRTLASILHDWIMQFLVPRYAEPGDVPTRLVNRLIDLAKGDGLLSIDNIHSRFLPWKTGPMGTAQPPDERYGFQLLVDQAARLLAGKELFRGRGAVRRTITSWSGAQGIAELITDSIDIPGRGSFSLVVALEVVTLPSIGQPLLKLDVRKRIWLSSLDDRTVDRRAMTATIFSSRHPDRAINFQLQRQKCEDGSRKWMPDNAFEVFRREFGLPLARMDGHAIARGDASTQAVKVLLREGSSRDGHQIKRGVPELDKLEAFEAAARLFESMGVIPFREYEKVRTHHTNAHEAISRTINAPTLLGAALELLDIGGAVKLTPDYLKTLSEQRIDELLQRQFRIDLGKINEGNRTVHENRWGQSAKDQSIELERLIKANREALKRLYPDERPLLLIFHEDGADAELRILKAVVRVLWGEGLELMINRLPNDAHGPRRDLPGNELHNTGRAALRIDAWRPFAQQIARQERPTFCLVMASDWYQDPFKANAWQRDDRVNKPAARQALATIGRACTQYLLPPKTSRDGTIDLPDFLFRCQSAMRDLISAHSGRIEGVRDAVVRCFGDTDGMRQSLPREIIAITIVRKTSGRSRGSIGVTFVAVAIRISVQNENCDMRSAFEGSNGLTISTWEPFRHALGTISRISPVRLGATRDISRTRFLSFVDHVISESVDEGANPVVIIDSSNCVQLWNWLADKRLDVSNITLGQRQWMQDNWKGARIIRVRQDLAPAIVQAKERRWAFTSRADTRPRDDLTVDMSIKAPSSPAGLFRLRSRGAADGCVCYLSVGHKTLHMNKRGASCYRTTDAAIALRDRQPGGTTPIKNAAGLPVFATKQRDPWINQWPTPNPLEIVVTLRQASDDPDRLAELLEHLRYGFGHYSEWTSLPAPLFFERVVQDYVSWFSLSYEDENIDDETVFSE